MRKLFLSLAVMLIVSVSLASSVRVAISSNPPTLDPQVTFNGFSFAVTNQIYETLVRVNTAGEIVPGLAAEWSYPEEGVLRFTLREGVTFHDGTPLTAEVVQASFARLLDPATTAPGRFVVSAIDEVRVVDELTVEIVTEPPFAPLLSHLSHPVSAIVPAQHADTLGRSPVGTGPFTFVEWIDGTQVSLAANPDYWGGAPEIETVTYRIIPEVSTQIIELRAGGVDIIFNVPPDNFRTLAAVDGIEAESFLGWGSVHLGFNLNSPKLEDVRVRQAIAHAIDKEGIVEDLLQGQAQPAVAPIPPTVRFAADLAEPYPYNPERARELLDEAGVSNLTLRLDIYQNPDLENVAQAMQFLLSEVGINLDIRVHEYAAYVEAAQADTAEVYATAWGTVTLDADYTLYAFFHSSEIPQNNLSRYRNADVDALLEEGRNNPADEARAEAYLEVQEQALNDVPMVTLYYPLSNYAKRAALEGEVINFSWINLDLRNARIAD
jgi:peptide/nickel transport system substrate-binding protein